jgi:ribonuclease D
VAETPRVRAFAALFDWRDAVARVLDESPYFVCPPRALARMAEAAPRTVDEL